jgi:hypothetical protein
LKYAFPGFNRFDAELRYSVDKFVIDKAIPVFAKGRKKRSIETLEGHFMEFIKVCPRCFTPLEVKKSPSTNTYHLVCPNYPDCRSPLVMKPSASALPPKYQRAA